MRLDAELVARGLAQSRARAQALIDRGVVRVNGGVVAKAASSVADTDTLTLDEPDHPYVSRAALKLLALIEGAGVDLSGRKVLDVGASTGGFTQVVLERGAAHVTAVDVGSDQLHPTLRADPRVTVMENTDARTLVPRMLAPQPDLIVTDLSFISQTLVVPVLLGRLPTVTEVATLIKPQFELTPADVGKGGLVKDSALWDRACVRVGAALADAGFDPVWGPVPCPVVGADGNQEFLLYARRRAAAK
jgi:23S rRNA (cytidine1920-2'-O)/16S rRNA (cytidine1409-2'-O)-methyltransferase